MDESISEYDIFINTKAISNNNTCGKYPSG